MKEETIDKIKNNKKWLLFCICLIMFVFILINILNGNIVKFDSSIYNMINMLRSDFMDMFFKTITRFADEEPIILIAIFCYILIKNKKISGNIVINLASIALINHMIKEIVQRPRPPIEYRMVHEASFSFPSGHAMTSMAFYGLIIYFIQKNIKNKKVKNLICICLSILIFLIGVSRIYLGVHYASDVLAGFVLSIAYLIIYITYILKLFKIN